MLLPFDQTDSLLYKMKLVTFCITAFLFLLSFSKVQACSDEEFKCIWDGTCIPRRLMCDGKHNCPNGEDENVDLAKCKHCPGQFHCNKNPDQIECVAKDYTCDDYPDCLYGEDELPEFAGCERECPKQDKELAELAGRRSCRKKCTSNKKCKPPLKLCLCDYECGMSCVNINKTCAALPLFQNVESIWYIKRDRKTNKVDYAKEPFFYDVEAHHKCKPGFVAWPNNVRYCHGRGPGDDDWTKPIVCARSCPKKKPDIINLDKLTCGMDCYSDADCAAGKSCTCDGPCGRTCVNLEIDCPDPPPVENADIEYTGEKFERVAHYLCKEGTYAASGDLSRKCTGSGKWGGVPVQCKKVVCGNPLTSIASMRGRILNNLQPPYYYNTTLEFACAEGQRLVGSKERTCMADGRWSGVLTVCDNLITGDQERCTHPGVPINGYIEGGTTDYHFEIGREVTFQCYDGYAMLGDEKQECLFYKQWSGNGAPLCVDPRYSHIPSDVINKLSQSTSTIRDSPKYNSAGRSVQINQPGGIEIYFLIDLSLSVSVGHLTNTVAFAKGLVRRLNRTVSDSNKVKYGIIVFATVPSLVLDIFKVPTPTPDEVIKELDKQILNLEVTRKEIKGGTDIQGALSMLDRQQISISWELDDKLIVKRHCFVLSDGKKNAGGDPGTARRAIDNAYIDNPPEFYSITSSAKDKDYEAVEQLQEIASNDKNFIYVEDFYKLSKYIDEVTDAREDYSVCGQSENVGELRKMATAGRVAGGTSAKNKAWPWQVLIHLYDQDIVTCYSRDMILGGGSLINSQWILSAAHVFWEIDDGTKFWHEKLVLSMGITRRPMTYNELEGSIEMYQPEKIYIHEDFDNDIYTDDIALIKIGGLYTTDKKEINPPAAWPGNVTFTPYIRPVCLPCSPQSCVTKILMKQDPKGNVLLTGEETPEEKCQIEHDFIVGTKNVKSQVGAFVTGFGHNETWKQNARFKQIITKNLQQGLLKIEKSAVCKEGAEIINDEKVNGINVFDNKTMICAKNANAIRGEITDACKGDSGGPLVREVVDEDTRSSCFVQIGIVSWGHGCADHKLRKFKVYTYPGYFVKVASYLSWMQETMDNHVVVNKRK